VLKKHHDEDPIDLITSYLTVSKKVKANNGVGQSLYACQMCMT